MTESQISFNGIPISSTYSFGVIESLLIDVCCPPNNVSTGNTGERPKTTLYGTHFVALLIEQFIAKIKLGRSFLHLNCGIFVSNSVARNISLTLRMFLSAKPLPALWYGDERLFSIPKFSQNSRIVSPSTFDPWSLKMYRGLPWVYIQLFLKDPIIDDAVCSRKGRNSLNIL